MKLIVLATAAATLTLSGVASADAQLTFPADQAACVAKAWVPFNTDPEVEAGALGEFISETAPKDDLQQHGCK